VIEMPNVFHVPATGAIEYQYTLVNYTFTEDTWMPPPKCVQEIRR